MSALRFHKLPHSSGTCHSDNCNRSGRFKMILCDYVVPAENPLKGSAFLVCGVCRKEQEALWDELSSETPRRACEQAAGAILNGRTEQRTAAIFDLRDWGWKAGEISSSVSEAGLLKQAA